MNPVERLLSALRVDRCIPLAELAATLGIEEAQVANAARLLIERGYASRAETGCLTLTREGLEFRTSGGAVGRANLARASLARASRPRQSRRRSLAELVWTALRVHGRGSVVEVSELVSRGRVSDDREIRRYLVALARAGYLARLRDERLPNGACRARWQLIRDTGPEAPRCRSTRGVVAAIYDPNTGETHPLPPKVPA